MSKIGKRVIVDSESRPELNGLEGICLAFLDGSNPPSYRVSFDNGEVGDLPGIVLQEVESDITTELTRPPLPPVLTEDDQQTASVMAARVYSLYEYQRNQIAAIELQIKQEQARVAQSIRAEHSELYNAQRVTAAVWAAHEARIKSGAESVWLSKGRPAKGKTYGAAQIATEWNLTQWDEDAALAYALTQAPNLIQTRIDSDRFQKAVKQGLLSNVPPEACTWEESYTVKVLTKTLSTLLNQSESASV